MLTTIAATLASLTLFASTTIAGLVVTRSSLMGFEILGPQVAVLELEDAADILARAEALASERRAQKAPEAPAPVCDALDPDGDPCAELPADMLDAPREAWPGSGIWTETWRSGAAARRREGALRRALPTVQREMGRRTIRLSSEPGADRETVSTMTLTYSVPKWTKAPKIL